ncbi:unnamed protein product [Dracunculus medinensis]|uniref:Metallophos domain-containing protein n=1 Tax=Dracunculus medinensis TaxID=318479 RepID=A0A0N4UR37_DRAME|nr:unnamed protein product [Dracunculus medinensis]
MQIGIYGYLDGADNFCIDLHNGHSFSSHLRIIFCKISAVNDYRRGNRLHLLAVLKYELMKFPLSIFTYNRLVSFIHSNQERRSLNDKFSIKHQSKSYYFTSEETLNSRKILPLIDSRYLIFFSINLAVVISLVTFINSDNITIKEITIKLKDLPNNATGLRFALISDLHIGGYVNLDQILMVVHRVNSKDVDAVFIDGDIVDGQRDDISEPFKTMRHIYRYLRSKMGTYLVTGNHEYYFGNAIEWLDYFKSIKINVLDNRNVNISGICLAGLNDYSSGRSGITDHKFEIERAIENCDQNSPVIILSHNPASAKEIAFNIRNLRVDLILSGHTHAGQFYTIAPIVYWFLPYFHGLYHVSSHTQLLVSAGTLYQGSPMKMLFMSELWIISLDSSS